MQILQCLSVQGGGGIGGDGSASGISRAAVKDRFKTFNVQFEELHQRQSQWTVPDSELRESLRLAVAEVLLPAYRSFLKRFGYDSLIIIYEKKSSFFFSFTNRNRYCFCMLQAYDREREKPSEVHKILS